MAALMSVVMRTHIVGVHWGADGVVQWFIILGSYIPVHYKIYTFCPLENGIELETIGIIFNWDISTSHSHPSATENIA